MYSQDKHQSLTCSKVEQKRPFIFERLFFGHVTLLGLLLTRKKLNFVR